MPKPSADNPPGPRHDATRWLLLLAGTLVAGPALLPLVVGFLPALFFQTDPRVGFNPESITAFGPAGSAVWQVGCGVAAAIAMSIYLALGGRVRWGWVVLAAVGAAAALWQMGRDAENLLPGGAWLAGVSLAVVGCHLGRFDAARRWMVALVVAMLVPVGLQASYDVIVQKPRDMAFWNQHEAEILEQHGTAPGSPQHQLLRRRAFSNDATGPFGFSNPLGTLAGGGAVLALCMGIGVLRGRGPASERRATISPAALAPIGAGVCGLSAVWFTHSTGAAAAVTIAGALVGASALLTRTRMRRAVAGLALCAVAVPIVAVLARGAAGPPESMAGERSLLFRFHYWEASARITAEHLPGSALWGVGPSDFQHGYLLHKNPLNPETVASAHGVFVDWAVYLGLGGVAWCALMLGWLWCAGRGVTAVAVDRDADATRPDPSDALPVRLLRRPAVVAAMAFAAAVFGIQYLVQLPMMDTSLALIWIAGAAGFVVVASIMGQCRAVNPLWERLGLLGIGVVVLVHSQIEMGFALMATAVPCWFLLGLAGSGRAVDDAKEGAALAARNRLRSGSALVFGLLLAILLSVFYAGPMVRHQSELEQASRQFAAGRPYKAMASLQQAEAILPSDTTAPRWIATARRDEMLALSAQGDASGARQAFELALEAIDRLIARGGAPVGIRRVRASLLREASFALGDMSLREAAAEELEKVAALSPYNLSDAVRLGDLHAERGDAAGAKRAYERALRIDDQLYLDTAMQLDNTTRARIRGTLDAMASGNRRGAVQHPEE